MKHARVIQQVDNKFIACLIEDELDGTLDLHDQGGGQQRLILIDQHAADERVRVEKYLKPLCLGYLDAQKGVNTLEIYELDPPFPILLTSGECARLVSSDGIQRELFHWGIRFDTLPPGTSSEDDNKGSGYTQVFVRSVPGVLCDKVTLDSVAFLHLTITKSALFSYLSGTSFGM